MRIFFDTSALVKLFVPEAGTDEMNAMLAQAGMEIWVSALVPLEFHSMAWRRHREGQLDAVRVTALLDRRKGVFDLRPFLDRPGLQRLEDPAYFASVGVRFGALTWPHEEDIAPDTLTAHLELAAVA